MGLITNGTHAISIPRNVNHDNSMVGDGTPELPLRLNETVLYDINGGTEQPASITLSESMRNFEFVRVTVLHALSTSPLYEAGWGEIFTYPGLIKRMDVVIKVADELNNLKFDRQYFSTSDGITITRGNKQRHQLNATSVTSTTLLYDLVITKIVGVNRIQS